MTPTPTKIFTEATYFVPSVWAEKRRKIVFEIPLFFSRRDSDWTSKYQASAAHCERGAGLWGFLGKGIVIWCFFSYFVYETATLGNIHLVCLLSFREIY